MHPNGSSVMSLLAHFSNQLEALFDALCQQLAAAPAGPFDDEVLISPARVPRNEATPSATAGRCQANQATSIRT